ncbi:MAG: polysaccharide biosynthesis protein, partial [Actinomycetota bacterium]|nr:polysaccharide biosynthesis protein [Actinomycetota bacterium]
MWGDRKGNRGGQPATWREQLAISASHLRADFSFALIDAFLVMTSYMTALLLRFLEGGVSPEWWESFRLALPVILVVHLVTNVVMGTYGHVWEYASIAEAKRVIWAALSALAILIVGSLTLDVRPVPLSVLILGSMFALLGMGAVRFRSRLFSFRRGLLLPDRERTLIVGTGRPAADLARSVASGSHPMEVVGFVSPSPLIRVRRLAGLPVLGEVDDVPLLVQSMGIDEVIVASPHGSDLARDLVDLCVSVDVRLRILPDLNSVLSPGAALRDVRDLKLDDLLPRPTVSTDLASVSATLQGKRVLITGAGGSIGSEITAQVLRFGPSMVIALDNDETHLHEAMLGWQVAPHTQIVPALCDIRDKGQLLRVFARAKPEVVFHAAAHKHVPILEACPGEAVKTNVLGTANLLEAVRLQGAERFVLISTDKAVNPKGVMGATKRVAEMMIQSANAHDAHCIYSAVRFGNVLGSRGSVVPTFTQQIRRGGPVTVTDDRMTRYFMTVDEAVELVLQAGALSEGGEVFVLDMGEPVRIVDLAHRLIRLAGLVPGRDIEVRVAGMRPGEKLEEELAHGELLASP